ncbi:SDR family NAD(P)-dependent oxidoreductase [Micromonospora sp. NPDC049559]|uniref:SDR family NAD(P)-dependent oxidoreductase n=1 Tax=Micromonospora sp. NPDC049559 TaxID=3155923 RepID=UPI0034474A17
MANSRRGNVFITGAAAGIGAATTIRLAEAGYTVFAGVHRNTGTLSGLGNVRLVPVDVTDPASVADAADEIGRVVGARGLHAVINNAGVIVQGPLELLPPDELRRQFEVNTFGPVYVTQAFLPLLRAGAGRIVNISAPTARVAVPFMGPIGASKAALASISDALRLELRRWRVPVVVVEPGGTQTAIFAKAEEAARAALAGVAPDRAALYREHLAVVAEAAAKQKLGPVDLVAKAVVAAVEAANPRRHYAAGSGVRLFGVLSRLPAGLRERLVATAFGLQGIKPQPVTR